MGFSRRKAMCDEYDDERMAVFWRKLEQTDARKQTSEESDEELVPLVRIEPAPGGPSKVKPKALTR